MPDANELDPDTLATIYKQLGEMGDNGGFKIETINELKRKNPGYEGMIDAFMRSLSATRLGKLMSGQALMGLKQSDFDIRLCAVEDTANRILEYNIKLNKKVMDERDAILGKLQDFEDAANERQRESDERSAEREVRRNKITIAIIGAATPVAITIIEFVKAVIL